MKLPSYHLKIYAAQETAEGGRPIDSAKYYAALSREMVEPALRKDFPRTIGEVKVTQVGTMNISAKTLEEIIGRCTNQPAVLLRFSAMKQLNADTRDGYSRSG